MAIATNRAEFKQKVLRELGYPMIKPRVTDEQIEDRIDDALQVFYRRHYDGSERQYLVRTLTAEEASLKSVVMDPEVIGVVSVWPMQNPSGTSGSLLFNVPYQLIMSEIFGNNGGTGIGEGISSYVITRIQMNVLQEFLVGRFPIRYNEKTNILYIDGSAGKFSEGTKILIECFMQNTAADYPDVWSDVWFKKYVTALVKKQWGQNMSGFSGIALPGGITVNGNLMIEQAEKTLEELEDELISIWGPISHDFMG